MALEYDIAMSYLFRNFPNDFIELAVGEVSDVELADPNLKSARFADAVAQATVRLDDSNSIKIIVHIEFQTDADKTMPRRMVGYIGRLIDAYDVPVSSTVIYLRPQEIDDPGVYQYTFPSEFTARYSVIKIWELDGEEILEKRILGVLPLTPLMQPEGVSDEEWMRKCVQTIETSDASEQDKKDLLANTSILSGLVYDANFVNFFISEDIMRKSSVVRELIEKELAQKHVQYVIFALETKLGTLEDAIKDNISSLDDELLNHLLRRAVLAEKSELEKEVKLLCA